MYIWKIEELKQDLISQKVSESDSFRYFFILSLMTSFIVLFPAKNISMWHYLDSLVNLLMTILGLTCLYRINGSGEGIRFLERFFALSFVLIIRFCPLIIIFSVALVLVQQHYNPAYGESGHTSWDFLFSLTFSFIYYWRLATHFNDIAFEKGAQNSI